MKAINLCILLYSATLLSSLIVYSKFLVDFLRFLGRQPYCLQIIAFSFFSIFTLLMSFSYLIALAITSNIMLNNRRGHPYLVCDFSRNDS